METSDLSKFKIVRPGNRASTNASQAIPSGDVVPSSTCAGIAGSNTVKMAELCENVYKKKPREKKRKADNATAPVLLPTVCYKRPIERQEVRSAGPRVEIINGRMVVKESSLVVGQEASLTEGDFEEVEEDIHATATYSSFLKRNKIVAWGIEETRLFYLALRQCGLEFSIMQTFFPGRTRRQIKAKFQREEKQHPQLVAAVLNNMVPLDMTTMQLQLDKSGKGVDDKDRDDDKDDGAEDEDKTDIQQLAAVEDISDDDDDNNSSSDVASAIGCNNPDPDVLIFDV